MPPKGAHPRKKIFFFSGLRNQPTSNSFSNLEWDTQSSLLSISELLPITNPFKGLWAALTPESHIQSSAEVAGDDTVDRAKINDDLSQPDLKDKAGSEMDPPDDMDDSEFKSDHDSSVLIGGALLYI